MKSSKKNGHSNGNSTKSNVFKELAPTNDVNLTTKTELSLTEENSAEIKKFTQNISAELLNLGANAARRMTLERNYLQAGTTQENTKIFDVQKANLEQEAGAIYARLNTLEKMRLDKLQNCAKEMGIDLTESNKKWSFNMDTMTFSPVDNEKV